MGKEGLAIHMVRYRSILAWFQDTVRREPEHIAVKEYRDGRVQTMTYRELYGVSYGLSGQLKSWYRGGLIFIAARSALYLTEWVLAALWHGYPFLLLDETVTAERFYSLCQDDTLVLTDWEDWRYPVLKGELHRGSTVLRSSGMVPSLDERFPDRTQTILYQVCTSGSGGRPKRIGIRQEGILNYIDWRIRAYQIHSQDVILQILSPMFDGFYSNFFTALLSGAVLLCHDFRRTPGLTNAMRQEAVTQMSLTPSLLHLVLTMGSERDFVSLRQVVVGGERCSQTVYHRFRQCCPHAVLANEYGMAENCIATTAQTLVQPEDCGNIGTPIDQTAVYLLDDSKRPVAQGEMGELYVTGVGLARGYESNEEETRRRFLCLPDIAAQRLYKTGDFAVRLADGSYRYMTREDRQVKINGCRIELDEVQQALLTLPSMDEAYAFCTEDEGQQPVIEAFLYSSKPIVLAQLRFLLRAKLSDSMLPQRYYLLEKPGCFDRKPTREQALSYSALCRDTRRHSGRPARVFAAQIQQAWEGILRTSIRWRENIFRHGVTSYTVMLAYAELCKLYGDALSLTDLYQHKTIWKLAKYIEQKMG